eukprot:jgi/Chlat1/2731/Chrsp182S02887
MALCKELADNKRRLVGESRAKPANLAKRRHRSEIQEALQKQVADSLSRISTVGEKAAPSQGPPVMDTWKSNVPLTWAGHIPDKQHVSSYGIAFGQNTPELIR